MSYESVPRFTHCPECQREVPKNRYRYCSLVCQEFAQDKRDRHRSDNKKLNYPVWKCEDCGFKVELKFDIRKLDNEALFQGAKKHECVGTRQTEVEGRVPREGDNDLRTPLEGVQEQLVLVFRTQTQKMVVHKQTRITRKFSGNSLGVHPLPQPN
ncbi:MAG: protein of unknown function DUF2089 [Siphoviridae sp. cttb18]|nr:MAG: protein of unknown function DUF2089 [Siphoviridae sp. cttb18]